MAAVSHFLGFTTSLTCIETFASHPLVSLSIVVSLTVFLAAGSSGCFLAGFLGFSSATGVGAGSSAGSAGQSTHFFSFLGLGSGAGQGAGAGGQAGAQAAQAGAGVEAGA